MSVGHRISPHSGVPDLCSNRTCEIGLNLATGRDYELFVYLSEELTRPA